MKTVHCQFFHRIDLSGVLCMLFFVVNSVMAYGQHSQEIDSIFLKEVVVIGFGNRINNSTQQKLTAGVEDYLESLPSIGMVKRGVYAQEPTINNMNTERINLSIDGMKIFGACTDKMDPITSYVEVSNLSKAEVSSGQMGSMMGNSIGGALNLITEKGQWGIKDRRLDFISGYESNNALKVMGLNSTFSNESTFLDLDIMLRSAENYAAAKGQEVLYSGYHKFNFSMGSGFKLNENESIALSAVFDRATDIGYPALPMDVSLARAIIGSVTYSQKNRGLFENWETKVYYNHITHIMDDTERTNVPIHMDMPGWSETFGSYSKMEYFKNNHHIELKWDAFLNTAYAEMTMYPNNSDEKEMFMLTWPDVLTVDTGIALRDEIQLGSGKLSLQVRSNVHQNDVRSDLGLSSLQIFYPQMKKKINRGLYSVASNFQTKVNQINVELGMAYGNRAPSVSEAYGFYLYNSFDNHDYIGNPHLISESSLEFNFKASLNSKRAKVNFTSNFFHMPNYIIGVLDPSLSKMTIGAEGVKHYVNLAYARQFNLGVFGDLKYNKNISATYQCTYHRGYDHQGENLPFIAPLEYNAQLQFKNAWSTLGIQIKGALAQNQFNASYGEDSTPAYQIINFSFSKNFYLGADQLQCKLGVENLFDRYYSTYLDWNNIPRMGRNIYLNMSYKI